MIKKNLTMTPALDLELIRSFMTVISEGDFKTAAGKLNKTPAAISQQIKRLEEILGQKLFERNNKGTTLTAHGNLLREKGQQLLKLNYEILGDMRQEDLAGRLTFGAPTDYTPELLQNLLPVFQQEFPKVDPVLVLEPSRSLRKKVVAGEIDIAIVAREPASNAAEKEGIYLWAEEVQWHSNLSMEDSDFQAGLLSTDCVLRDQALRMLSQAGYLDKIKLQAMTVDALRVAAEQNFCAAFLPLTVGKNVKKSAPASLGDKFNLEFALISGPALDQRYLPIIASKFSESLKLY